MYVSFSAIRRYKFWNSVCDVQVVLCARTFYVLRSTFYVLRSTLANLHDLVTTWLETNSTYGNRHVLKNGLTWE